MLPDLAADARWREQRKHRSAGTRTVYVLRHASIADAYALSQLLRREGLPPLGFVNELFDSQEQMLAHVMKLAEEIAAKSPLAVHGSKVMINYARDHSIADGLDYIATWQAGMYNPAADMAESFGAKTEKREAVYDDLLPLRKTM